MKPGSLVSSCKSTFVILPSVRIIGLDVLDVHLLKPRHGVLDHCQTSWVSHSFCTVGTCFIKTRVTGSITETTGSQLINKGA